MFDKSGERPRLVTGTPGGYYISGRASISHADAKLELEGGFSPDVELMLHARGHTLPPSMTMGTQTHEIRDGLFLGASDTRRPDALALGVRLCKEHVLTFVIVTLPQSVMNVVGVIDLDAALGS